MHAYYADFLSCNAKHNFQQVRKIFHNTEFFPSNTKWHFVLQANQTETECGARTILAATIFVAAQRPDSAFSSLCKIENLSSRTRNFVWDLLLADEWHVPVWLHNLLILE